MTVIPLTRRRIVRPHVGPASLIAAFAAATWALSTGLVLGSAPADRAYPAVREALIVGAPLAVGLHATRTPQFRRFGIVLAAAGFSWSLTALAETSDSVAYSSGRVAAWLVLPALFYLMLIFPHGRLTGRVERAALVLLSLAFAGSALFVNAYPAQTPWATCGDCPRNAFLVLDGEPAIMRTLVQPARDVLAIAVATGVILALARRMRRATPIQRSALAPVTIVSLVSAATLSAYLVVRWADPRSAAVGVLGTLWSLTLPAVATAFLLGIVRGRLLVAAVLERLSAALKRGVDPRGLRMALARALDDPSIDLLVPAGVPGEWRNSAGELTSRAAAAGGASAVTVLGEEAAPEGALVHDPALGDDEHLLSSVSALLLATLRQRRLQSELARSLSQLEDSRKRIARAADLERSRIERDLHDGAQQRLIGLRIRLTLAAELLRDDPAGGDEALSELGNEIDRILEELRSLAHGLYPALLSDRGLSDALRSATTTSVLPVHLDVRGVTRHPAEVETAVYFTCLEALQNAVKHARGASAIWVSLRQNHVLAFEVRDDGAGFELPGADGCGGLRNMRDRVEAVGGRLTVDAAPGHGTRVRGRVPLG